MKIEKIVSELSQGGKLIGASDAEKLNKRVRFFTEPRLEKYVQKFGRSDYMLEHLRYAQSRLSNPDAIKNYELALSVPLDVNSTVKKIYDTVSKVWNAKDKTESISMKNADTESEAKEFLELLQTKEKVWELYQANPCDLLFVNIEKEESEIEFCIEHIRAEDVIYIDCENHNVEWIAFRYEDNQVAVICDEFYRILTEDYRLISEVAHNLGKCPVSFVSIVKFNEDKTLRSNIVTNAIGMVEKLQFYKTLKDIQSPNAFYQFIIRQKLRENCDYTDGINACSDGYLQSKETQLFVRNEHGVIKCPVCNKGLGVGNIIETPMRLNDTEPEITNVLQFVSPQSDILEYSDKFLENYEQKIIEICTGKKQQINTKLNHNETAYKFNLEDEKAVIMQLKHNFEVVIGCLNDCALRLKYGNAFVSYYLNLGTEFSLTDLQTLYEELELANKVGMSDVLNIQKQIVSTKYASNPVEYNRSMIINGFLPHLKGTQTEQQVGTVSGVIPHKLFAKQNFVNDFITWVENKTKTPIELYATDIPLTTHITELNKFFDEYYLTLNFKLNETTTSTNGNSGI